MKKQNELDSFDDEVELKVKEGGNYKEKSGYN